VARELVAITTIAFASGISLQIDKCLNVVILSSVLVNEVMANLSIRFMETNLLELDSECSHSASSPSLAILNNDTPQKST
jgi:hypothetical protein